MLNQRMRGYKMRKAALGVAVCLTFSVPISLFIVHFVDMWDENYYVDIQEMRKLPEPSVDEQKLNRQYLNGMYGPDNYNRKRGDIRQKEQINEMKKYIKSLN